MSSFIEAMVTAIRALRVWRCGILRWNTVNYSTVVDQSDYSISTILYNNMIKCIHNHYIIVNIFWWFLGYLSCTCFESQHADKNRSLDPFYMYMYTLVLLHNNDSFHSTDTVIIMLHSMD